MPGGVELSEKLPEEIFQLVESFKKFVREQKAYRDQKFDVDPILEISRDTEELTLAFQRVVVDSDRNAQIVQQIKDDTTKLLRHSELAYSLLRAHFANNPSLQQQHPPTVGQLTNPILPTVPGAPNEQTNKPGSNVSFVSANQQASSTPNQPQPFYLSGCLTSGSNHLNQFNNTSTSQYFAELADQFEVRMKSYGERIKELKMSLDSMTKTYNVDELFKWLKRQHETLGEIAAKIYMTHERIMEQKSEMDKLNSAHNNLKATFT